MTSWWERSVVSFTSSYALLQQAVPVFHRHPSFGGSQETLKDGTRGWVRRAACGIALEVFSENANLRRRGLAITRERAELFGRPCKRCWPGDSYVPTPRSTS